MDKKEEAEAKLDDSSSKSTKRPRECSENKSQSSQHNVKKVRKISHKIVNVELRRDQVPLALWDDDKQLASLIQERGKHIARMGFHESNKKWLHPEELAFMVTDGELDLCFATGNESEGLPEAEIMENSKAFGTVYGGMNSHKVSLMDYYTYVALKKLHFNVFRCGEWALEPARMLENVTAPFEDDPNASLLLRFDVYSPQKEFKLTEKGAPVFQIATSRPADICPSVATLRQLANDCESKNTKLRLSLFDGQSVSFLQVEDFKLPEIVRSNEQEATKQLVKQSPENQQQ